MIDLLCKKLPISCLLRGLLERCFSAERLDKLFEENAREQYTRTLLFSTTCELLLSVVLRIYPSTNAAYQERAGSLAVSITALYDKLKGVEVSVSSALVRETAADLSQILDALNVKAEPWLPGYSIRILDGNCLAATEKRLQVHQVIAAAALPGKSLVVLDPERRLLVDVFPCEDGHAQERALLGAVARTIRANELWIADRNFCTLGFLKSIHESHAYALIRLHGNLPWIEQSPLSLVAENAEEQRIYQQKILVDNRLYRRIQVELLQPTRDGDYYIDLITDLPATVKATKVADLYRKRWTLETAFQHLEKHFQSELNTLAYPRAGLFGFCLAVVAYNAFSVMLAALDSAHEKPVSETISNYYVAHHIAATFLALLTLSEELDWRFLATCSVLEFAQWLRETAWNVNLRALKKHSRGPKKPRQKPPYDPKHPHVSTYQLLQGNKNPANSS
jgi:hypothetical protein